MHPLLASLGRRPRTGIVLVCPECSVEFYASPSNVQRRRYCSHSCKALAQERQVRTACVMCGVEFGQAKSIGRKYCSRACYERDRQPQKECKACGVALHKSALTYCSQACMAIDRRTGVEKFCQICGQAMYVAPYLVATKKVCSRACNHELKRIDGPGSRVLRQDGYIAVYYPRHPDASKDGYILEHRMVMAQKLGRRLTRAEQVNHINHDRADNRPENLEVMSAVEHQLETSVYGKKQRQAAKERLAEYERRFGPLT